MAGGLMQLVAYGAQDVYLTGNPKVTFFQAVYKRHTNFALENIQQTVNGSANSGNRISVTIARNGDLIGEMYMKLYVRAGASLETDGNAGCWLAERAISDIELSVGGQRIDKHYQRWWRLYSELYLDESKKANYGKMTSCPTGAAGSAVYLPLLFFFNRNAGLYLPLIALQYHEVRLDFDLSSEFTSLFTQSPEVWGNYVYLDTEERRRFAQKGHEYLIEQVQHTGTDSMQTQIRLSYNHPVKELVWCITQGLSNGSNLWNLTTSSGIDLQSNTLVESTSGPISHMSGAPFLASSSSEQFVEEVVGPLKAKTFKLVLNGQDRFKEQDGKFFNQVQPYWHHTGNPYPGIYSYSFALKPEEHQPTGTCNFSRIDNAQVQYSTIAGLSGYVQDMYAVNYNVFRIQAGMGGLAFSN
jgi:hypothetical protein